jgi:bacteriocin biosynthesis cyclodehydratase domain-containing protein
MKANLEHYAPYMLYEQQLRAGHTPPAVGTLRPFQRLLGELAAVEAVKLLTRFSPPTTVGRLYTLDLLTLEARHHDVLKLPRCPACGEPARSAPMMRPWSE